MDQATEARIAVRVAELRLLAAFTAANFEAVLARLPQRPSPSALPGYLIGPSSRIAPVSSLRRGAGLLFQRRND